MNKKALFIIFITASVLVYSLNSCDTSKPKAQTANEILPTKDSLIKRGNYLVSIIGCGDCHSPKHMGAHGPEIDSLNMLSGFPSNRPHPAPFKGKVEFADDLTAAVGPWGTTFAANITSDPTGIGNWSEEQFKNALRHGKHKGLNEERDIMPPMPWQNFSQLTDADLKAVFYYLKSTKPFKNVVPDSKPAKRG
jgi:hypothetical protein